jgi:endonuclease/exonuclease/phosphatase family metal-dependent hydrolase
MNESITVTVPVRRPPTPHAHASRDKRVWLQPRSWAPRHVLLAVVAIALVVWVSSLRIPAGPDAGTTFDGPAGVATLARDTFRVGVFNIHGGRGRDNHRDLARTADDLQGLDFIGLNEVLGPKTWWQTDQCQQLAEALGMAWLFAPTESRWWDGSFGNGVLTALPVLSWQRIPLPRAGAHTYRNVVLSTVDVGGRRVHVLVAHLDSRDIARRQEQLRTIGELFLSLAPPAILMGDLNTPPGDPQLAKLLGTPGVADALAGTAAAGPSHRIDWILIHGLRSVASGCDDHGASDHPLYWAELEIVD